MKNKTFALIALLLSGAVQADTITQVNVTHVEEYVDQLTADIKALPVSFLDRPLKSQAFEAFTSGLCIFVGAAAGHLTTCAIYNLLGGHQRVNFLSSREWTRPQQIGTAAGAALGAYAAYKSNDFIGQIDKPLLIAVLETANNNNKLMNALDELNVSSRFPRAAGFNRLEELRSNLADLVDLLSILVNKPYGNQIKAVLPDLKNCLTTVKQAMIALKKDPRWFEECNAQSLAQTQASVQAHQNAQLTAGVIQLAHVASR